MSQGKGHGRIEKRECYVVEGADFIDPSGVWDGFRSVAMLVSERRIGDKVSVERRYYLTSLGGAGTAKRVLRAVRRHWGIENRLHWVLDVAYGEDKSRVRSGNAAQNLSMMRQVSLNLLRQSPDTKTSIRLKRKRAAWESGYLEAVLIGASPEKTEDTD